MRLLFLNHNVAFTSGATFYRALHFGKRLAQRGHQVTLIASSPRSFGRFSEREVEGVRLVEAPGILPSRWRYGYDPLETIHRVSWVKSQRFDIVQAFESRPTVIYPALAAKKGGSRLIMDWCDWFGRGGAAEQRSNRFLRSTLSYADTYYEEHFRRQADATIVINTALASRAQHLGVPPERIFRIPNGSDIENIKPTDPCFARSSLGLPMSGPLLGYVGSLFSSDAHLLCESFSRVRTDRPDACLLMIGDPKVDIPFQEGIIRTGFVSYKDLNLSLAACDVLLLPLADTIANRGRWPSKIGDYFSAGRPIVACPVGDMQEVILETQAGLVSNPEPDSFAGEILTLLNQPVLRTRLGENARRAAEGPYNWSVLVDQVETIYRGVLS